MYNIKSTFNSNNIEGLTNNNYTITFNKINSSRDSPTKTNNSRDSLTKMNINKDKNKKMNNIIFSLIKINRDNKAILRKNSRDQLMSTSKDQLMNSSRDQRMNNTNKDMH